MRQTHSARGTAPSPPARPNPPASVSKAVRLMYAGAVVSVLSQGIALLGVQAFRSAVHQAHPAFSQTELNAAASEQIVFDIASLVIYLVAWLGVARASLAGHAWARVMASVLFALYTILGVLFLSAFAGYGAVAMVLSGLTWLIGLGAVVFLWRPDAREFFTTGPAR